MEQFDEVFESDEGSRTEQRGVGESKPESVECRKDDEYKHNHERWQNKQVGGNDGAEATILLLAVVEVHRFRPVGGRAGVCHQRLKLLGGLVLRLHGQPVKDVFGDVVGKMAIATCCNAKILKILADSCPSNNLIATCGNGRKTQSPGHIFKPKICGAVPLIAGHARNQNRGQIFICHVFTPFSNK